MKSGEESAFDSKVDVRSYGIEILLGDVVGILDQLQVDQVHVISHDWGAFLG